VKKIVQRVSFLAFLIVAPTTALALPFKPDPQSFQRYVNAVKWGDGSKVKFENLHDCYQTSDGTSYMCTKGYATITNPMGTRVCELAVVWPKHFSTQNCRYK
jgi:hypothetical protein